jgi:hypothetical protein
MWWQSLMVRIPLALFAVFVLGATVRADLPPAIAAIGIVCGIALFGFSVAAGSIPSPEYGNGS